VAINTQSFPGLLSFHSRASSPHFPVFSLHVPLAMLADPARVPALDLNVRLEDDDNGFDLNVGLEEDDYGNVFPCLILLVSLNVHLSLIFSFFWTGFDLNLPLDEYGAVDFDFVQNLHGNPACRPIILIQHVPYKICMPCLVNVLVFSYS